MKLPTLVSTALLQGAVRVAATTANSIEPAECEFDEACARNCSISNPSCFDECCTGGDDCLIDSSHVQDCGDEFCRCLGNVCSEEVGGYDMSSGSDDGGY
jgi:hypothetical protein